MDSKSDSEESDDEYFLRLDTLPPEIFLHICSFLSAKFVIQVLSEVCQKFRDLAEDETMWRMRVFRDCPKSYPLIPDPTIDWKNACIEREEQVNLWKNSGENMKAYHLRDAHIGCVNIVSIIENGTICASGGRDGALRLWNLSSLNEDMDPKDYGSCLLQTNTALETAHPSAWLWSLAYDERAKMMYTGAFDGLIKVWSLERSTSELTLPCSLHSHYSLRSAVLCLSLCGHQLAAGCYNGLVSLLDVRAPLLQKQYAQKRSVVCLVSDEKFIISGSEDKTLVVFDKTAGKNLETLQFESFPLSMSYDQKQLLIGDLQGNMHVVDPTHQKFKLSQTFHTGHKWKITGIRHSLGSIITASADKTLRVLEPCANPEPIAVINCKSEVGTISSYENTLVSAVDDAIMVWKPREQTVSTITEAMGSLAW